MTRYEGKGREGILLAQPKNLVTQNGLVWILPNFLIETYISLNCPRCCHVVATFPEA